MSEDEKRRTLEVGALRRLEQRFRKEDPNRYGLPTVCAAVLIRRARIDHAAAHLQPRRHKTVTLQRVCLQYINNVPSRLRRRYKGPARPLDVQSWGDTPGRVATKLRKKTFRDPVTGVVVRFELWDTTTDQEGYFVRPVFQWPAERENKGSTPEVSIRLPATGAEFFGRVDELAALDDAWRDPAMRVVTVIAFGGTGKTAVVRRWLRDFANDGWPGAKRILAWSFHSQGSEERVLSADSFVEDALRWFGEENDTSASRWEKGERLAAAVRRQPTLLILDGIEPMQFPPSDAAGGRLRDPALLALLTSLAVENNGLCIVTSRVPLTDLAELEPSPVRREDLRQLDLPAANALLRSFGLHGPEEELDGAATAFNGHALTLTLLGSFLRNAHEGDIRAWREVRPLRDSDDAGQQARRVMAAYRQWFGVRAELAILQLVGLFDRPVTAAEIAVLREPPEIVEFNDRLPRTVAEWRTAVRYLREARLLFEADDTLPDSLDAHPLVREYFGETLRTEAGTVWKEAHARLYTYLATSVTDQPDTLAELIPLYEAVAHGRESGQAEYVFGEVYLRRIQRLEEFFAFRKLGVTTIALACLSGFFDRRWTTVSSDLSADSAARVLNECSIYLRATGRLREAAEAAESAVRLREQQANAIEDGDARHDAEQRVATNAATVSEIYESLGNLGGAKRWAEFSVRYADVSKSPLWREVTRARLGSVLHQLGDLDAAWKLFEVADAITAIANDRHPRLFSLRGFQYHDLLLDLGEYDEVLRRAKANLEYAEQRSNPLDSLFAHLTLGRAHIELARKKDAAPQLREAAEHVDAALDILNSVAVQHHRVRTLIVAAAVSRARGNRDRGNTELTQARGLAVRYELHLLAVDCDLERSRSQLDEKSWDAARSLLDSIEKRVTVYGYRRRVAEIVSLREQLPPL